MIGIFLPRSLMTYLYKEASQKRKHRSLQDACITVQYDKKQFWYTLRIDSTQTWALDPLRAEEV